MECVQEGPRFVNPARLGVLLRPVEDRQLSRLRELLAGRSLASYFAEGVSAGLLELLALLQFFWMPSHSQLATLASFFEQARAQPSKSLRRVLRMYLCISFGGCPQRALEVLQEHLLAGG
jgi:hypothetical protein